MVTKQDWNLMEAAIKQPKMQYTHGATVNIYIVYDNDSTLKNCLFGAVNLTKNAIDKYHYSGYGIGFDRRSSFSIPSGGFGQNVLIFGSDEFFYSYRY